MAEQEFDEMTHVKGRTRAVAVALAVVVATCLATSTGEAVEPRAMRPFQVQAPDGTDIGSGQVALQGRQVLIYVDADCDTCALMFTALDGLEPAEVEAVAFIVRGDAPSAARLLARVPGSLANVRWFTDGQRKAYTALDLKTTPTVLGLWSGRIHWAKPGMVKDAAALQSAVRSWLGPAAPQRQP